MRSAPLCRSPFAEKNTLLRAEDETDTNHKLCAILLAKLYATPHNWVFCAISASWVFPWSVSVGLLPLRCRYAPTARRSLCSLPPLWLSPSYSCITAKPPHVRSWAFYVGCPLSVSSGVGSAEGARPFLTSEKNSRCPFILAVRSVGLSLARLCGSLRPEWLTRPNDLKVFRSKSPIGKAYFETISSSYINA